MITGEQKPLNEIFEAIKEYRRILIIACGTCVTVSFAGGEKEAKTLASKLRIKAKAGGMDKKFEVTAVLRQCEWEFLDRVKPLIRGADAVISTACGIGVQAIAEHFPDTFVVPGLNTSFMGMPVNHGMWEERCSACGDCIVHNYGGLCPITRCAKSLFNGPCGGSVAGKCEISPDIPCVWQKIYDNLLSLGRLDKMGYLQPIRDWKTNSAMGPRKISRKDIASQILPEVMSTPS